MIRTAVLAFRDLSERPLRAVLSVLGIAVGIATYISVHSLVTSFESAVAENIVATDTHIEVTESGAVDFLSSLIPEQLVSEVQETPGVEDVTAMLIRLAPLHGSSTPVLGWPDNSFLWTTIEVPVGKRPAASSEIEIMLGVQLATRLHLGIGDRLDVFNTAAKVVGIAQTASQINRSAIFMRLDDLQKLTFRKGQVTGLAVRVRRSALESIDDVQQAIQKRVGNYAVTKTSDLTRNNSLLRLAHGLTVGLSIIAVLLGLVSILSTTWTLVRERRHHFAVLTALGWSRLRISYFVFCETATIGISGWALGLATGIMAANLATRLPALAGFLDPVLPLRVFVLSAVAAVAICGFGTAIAVWATLSEEPGAVLRSP